LLVFHGKRVTLQANQERGNIKPKRIGAKDIKDSEHLIKKVKI